MKTAIIGLGNIGKQVALNLVAGGQQVLVADRGADTAREFAKQSNGKARPVSVAAAIEAADIIVFAVYFDAIKGLLTEYRQQLAGKIIVDPSNPIAPDGAGGFKKISPQEQSSGQLLAAMLPPGAKLVKAFGTLDVKAPCTRFEVLTGLVGEQVALDIDAYLVRSIGFEHNLRHKTQLVRQLRRGHQIEFAHLERGMRRGDREYQRIGVTSNTEIEIEVTSDLEGRPASGQLNHVRLRI
jgi:hypothetical protein